MDNIALITVSSQCKGGTAVKSAMLNNTNSFVHSLSHKCLCGVLAVSGFSSFEFDLAVQYGDLTVCFLS